MLSESDWKIGPLYFWHLMPKRHPGEFFFEALLFLRILRANQFLRKSEKPLSGALPG